MTDRIPLDTPTACMAELERCSYGLSQLTIEATRNHEALGLIEEQLEVVEAIAAAEVRQADEKPTATEIKGRIVTFLLADPQLAAIREAAHFLRTEAQTLDRRLRTLEKRSMNAQSALKKHDSESRNAGYAGASTNYGGKTR